MFTEVIVPVDGSDESARALGPASAVAHYLGVPLRAVVFHVPPDVPEELTEAVLAQMRDIGEVERFVDVVELEGSVASDLCQFVDKKDGAAIVMSTHGRGRSAAVVGSVAEEFLRESHRPVLLVGPECVPGRFRLHGPMIVAAQEDTFGDAALKLAAEAIETFDYEPQVINVLDLQSTREMEKARAGAGGYDLPPDSVGAHRLATDLEAATGLADVDFRVLHSSHPGTAIAERATEVSASLIVMATHARTGLDRFTKGSCTADVVGKATCPVLAVSP